MTSEKALTILDNALEILKDRGDAGLTMRGLAEHTGMRLSNVQYYYKSRDDVLLAMVDRYFGACTEELEQATRALENEKPEDRVRGLLRLGLSHGNELSDMCRIFRELWAIASRNDAVKEGMQRYYENFAALLAKAILQDRDDRSLDAKLQTLLVPYIEGYSITAQALPMPTEAAEDLLTEIILGMLPDGMV